LIGGVPASPRKIDVPEIEVFDGQRCRVEPSSVAMNAMMNLGSLPKRHGQ
jgi:hypothetical protein